ncbi:predicted protein [Naegleria gruberi]|uniref:Predicted protein n=1 Tax=Naegleria gruberi TaxID=5762 RepID=D2W5V2_NAEGR|nr:uncharacterized protein NAEGRDRAFT_76795 [Naegleria gruberi]EFC35551.1 predicted protein [Naegleria gruberi]|eukprot:XP_002668295.1 predicted protein [Naegleria gruberi strain NEG-M]
MQQVNSSLTMKLITFIAIFLMIINMATCVSLNNHPVTSHVNNDINYHQVIFDYMKDRSNENFKYQLLNSVDIPNTAKFYVFNMTSVKWLTNKEVSRSEWYHFVEIVVPYQITQTKQALMLIAGGSSNSQVPTLDKELIQMGVLTKSIVCTIHQIPNQPLTFLSDPEKKSRVEDAILAFAWARFMNLTQENDELKSNTEWIPRLPMVKSTLFAMDLVQEYLLKNLNIKVEDFHVAGASKRGWTTNLVGVVDQRVKSIIPIVIPIWKTREVLGMFFFLFIELVVY